MLHYIDDLCLKECPGEVHERPDLARVDTYCPRCGELYTRHIKVEYIWDFEPGDDCPVCVGGATSMYRD